MATTRHLETEVIDLNKLPIEDKWRLQFECKFCFVKFTKVRALTGLGAGAFTHVCKACGNMGGYTTKAGIKIEKAAEL